MRPLLFSPKRVRVETTDIRAAYDQVVSNSSKPLSDPASDVVLDHRPTARWEGSAPEPRPGLSSGHIPNSLPAPFAAYLAPADDKTPYTSYKSVSELKQVLVNAVGGDEVWTALEKGDRAVVFSCGSGMTAAIGWLANELVKEAEGRAAQKTALYDEASRFSSCKDSQLIQTELDRLCHAEGKQDREGLAALTERPRPEASCE